MAKRIGIATVGGDCPGTNPTIRAIGKTLQSLGGYELIGFQDGFLGLATNDTIPLGGDALSGILTTGGTILGTSRDRPESVHLDNQVVDATETIQKNIKQNRLDALVILGGKEVQESAYQLSQRGVRVLTMPLTIDNDIVETDATIGYYSATSVAAEAIDRLHSTAYSHHRIIIVEVMGRETGWLTLAAGLAGGADVILIPEIAYDEEAVAGAILNRLKEGKRFSIVAVSEGAISQDNRRFFEHAREINRKLRKGKDEEQVTRRLEALEEQAAGNTMHLAHQLRRFTGLETRVTILGYLQRGGVPSAADRVMATQMGTACAVMVHKGVTGCMVAMQNQAIVPVPLEQVAGNVKRIPLDHSLLSSARHVGTSLGEQP